MKYLIVLLALAAAFVQPAAAATGPKPTPKPTPKPAASAELAAPMRIAIGSIKLDRAIVARGLDKRNIPIVPDHDVAWYKYSAMPGQGENIVLYAHVLRFRNAPKIPAPFGELHNASKGDKVVLKDANGASFTYVITEQVWAKPDDVKYMLPTGKEMVTMISCIGSKVIKQGSVTEMSNRLITIAEPAKVK